MKYCSLPKLNHRQCSLVAYVLSIIALLSLGKEVAVVSAASIDIFQTDPAETTPEGGYDPDCPCIDSEEILAPLSNCELEDQEGLVVAGVYGRKGICWPITYGANYCSAFDIVSDPSCSLSAATNGSLPAYCGDPFCYVDKTKCMKAPHLLYQSDRFAGIARDLFYSYSTCTSTADDWKMHKTLSAFDGVNITFAFPRISVSQGHFKMTKDGEGVAPNSGEEYYDPDVEWIGYAVEYFRDILRLSNINHAFVTPRSIGSDIASPSSAWTATVHDIGAGLTDVGVSKFMITAERLAMSAFTTPVHISKIYLWVEQPDMSGNRIADNAHKVFRPFATDLWVMLIVTIVVVAVLNVWFANEAGSRSKWWRDLRSEEFQYASIQQKMRIVANVFVDTTIATSIFFMAHAVEYDLYSTFAQKVLMFGFAFVVIIAAASYTANLAAFLTLSGVKEYVATIEEAIAANKVICTHPVLVEELRQLHPTAKFVVNKESSGGSTYAILEYYDQGKCDLIVLDYINIRHSEKYMAEFCKRNLVSTNTIVLEKQEGFPIRDEYAAGLSYWISEGARNGIIFESYQKKAEPLAVCDLKISLGSGEDDMMALTSGNLIFPFLLLFVCIIVAIVLHMCSDTNKTSNSQRRLNAKRRSPRARKRQLPTIPTCIHDVSADTYDVSGSNQDNNNHDQGGVDVMKDIRKLLERQITILEAQQQQGGTPSDPPKQASFTC